MITLPWQLKAPIDAIIFDCDGTLSTIEGIDELATNDEVRNAVQILTEEAMGKTGINATIYEKRLKLVNPSQKSILDLGQNYIKHHTSHAKEVVTFFKHMNKPIYIISAGVSDAVTIFAQWLGINETNVYAVDISFNKNGEYLDFDHESPLVNRSGKRVVINELLHRHARLGYIGDGLNDYEVHDIVTRFIGYGGTYYRKNIAELCEFYIKISSLTPMLPLLLTQQEYTNLSRPHQMMYDDGMKMISQNQVEMNNFMK